MAINKVVYDNETLIDLTEDTVSEKLLIEGKTAHTASGSQIEGTMKYYGTVGINGVVGFSSNYPTAPVTAASNLSSTNNTDGVKRITMAVPHGAYIRDYGNDSGQVWVGRPATDFGTAIASDVANGKTFTSADGLRLTGTATGGSGGAEFRIGTFTPSASAASHQVTFDSAMSGVPDLIVFWCESDADSTSSARRTKGAIGVRKDGTIPFFGTYGTTTSAASFKRTQLVFYNSSTSGNTFGTGTGYNDITNTNTTAGTVYGLIRNATATGFKAYRYNSATYPFAGTYGYVAIKF